MAIINVEWFIPVWLIVTIVSIVLIITIFWFWALLDSLLTHRLSNSQKLFWFVIILVFNFFGALLYLIFKGFSGGETIAKKTVKVKHYSGKRLYRSKKDRVIAGVAGGLGDYLNTDPTLIRLIWVIVTVFTGLVMGILAYIIAWIVIPEEK
ncbi:PspC domain-containing protein [Candidatus Woesearchaeota archaeon]|nr:PspC domain-containing protein [Candidatus Woesearchaeota archaeon]